MKGGVWITGIGKRIREKISQISSSSAALETSPRSLTFTAVVGTTLLLITWFLFANLPVTYNDWLDFFRPAALHWRNPYSGFIFNPPWIFPLLYPLALLPYRAGAGLLMIISVVAVAMYVGSPKKTLVVALSVPMVVLITLGQLDALLLFGLMIPKGLGLPILVLKPQGVFLTMFRRLNRWSISVMLLILLLSFLV